MGDTSWRLLIAEDEPSLSRLLEILFADEGGYELVAVDSVDAAVARLEQERFHLVLADGFSSTARGVVPATAPIVAAAGETAVVLFTSHALEDEEILAAGFRGVIQKPFQIEDLLRQVRAFLG